MVRRSRFEIYMDTLDAMNGTDKPTRLMYKANLSWNALEDALSTLIKCGLVVVIPRGKGKSYRRTKKGDKAIFYYYILVGLFKGGLNEDN